MKLPKWIKNRLFVRAVITAALISSGGSLVYVGVGTEAACALVGCL